MRSIECLCQEVSEENGDITLLAPGKPWFSIDDIEIELDESGKLFLAFPKELAAKLQKNSGEFEKDDCLFEELTVPGHSKEEVGEAVSRSKERIAQKFIERSDGLYFNGIKYGIKYADGFSRTCDDIERPLLTVKLFITDHFTHRVLSDVADSLEISPREFTLDSLNREYNWVRTSLGLSILVILKSTNQILMTRRAKNASYSEGKSWIYVSVTETFTETDFDRYTHTPNLRLCVKRAVLEELGITEKMYDEPAIRFYDLFFETHFHQDGIVVSMELKKEVTFDEIKKCFCAAKDSLLETEQLFLLDNRKKVILDYIENHRNEMRSQTVFALRSYAARTIETVH